MLFWAFQRGPHVLRFSRIDSKKFKSFVELFVVLTKKKSGVSVTSVSWHISYAATVVNYSIQLLTRVVQIEAILNRLSTKIKIQLIVQVQLSVTIVNSCIFCWLLNPQSSCFKCFMWCWISRLLKTVSRSYLIIEFCLSCLDFSSMIFMNGPCLVAKTYLLPALYSPLLERGHFYFMAPPSVTSKLEPTPSPGLVRV